MRSISSSKLSFVMYPCKQLETSDQACFQDLAPATPSHSQQDDASPALQSEREVSSGSKREDSQQQNSVPVQADLCRADLSGAALLIVQELAAFRSSEESNIAVGKDSRSPFRQKKAFGNGNYNRYYGYRLAKGETEDPRLQVMEKRWFVNKQCLDIGCNEGHLTLAMAARFQPASMLGIDIDQQLIKRACQALQTRRAAATEILQSKSQHPHAAVREAQLAQQGLSKVWFQQNDFLSSKLDAGSFQTITCMSVTKWLHLHGGDDVMREFFQNAKDLLQPGGYFILEPQPWKSYKSANRKLNAQKVEHISLGDIHWKPEQFQTILTTQFGFRLLKKITNPSKKAGFDRNIYWFKKL